MVVSRQPYWLTGVVHVALTDVWASFWLWNDQRFRTVPNAPNQFHQSTRSFPDRCAHLSKERLSFQALTNISKLQFLCVRFSFKFYSQEVEFIFLAVYWGEQTRKYFCISKVYFPEEIIISGLKKIIDQHIQTILLHMQEN